MKTIDQRLNNIIGQLEGAKKMLADQQRDCFSLLIQLKAARSAISALMEKVIGEEFNRCLVGPRQASRPKIEKIFREVINK
ncbi:MAG: metal-sensitive transcriptional regulator [Patescibacteria group bacterium]